MAERFTVGVLSTSFGGSYFGGILGGIARATAAAGGRLIGIQTLDAGTVNVDLPEPPDFRYPVAWDHITAFVTILNSADRAYLTAIQATGKPVVMISDDLAGFPCPVVLPDNQAGVRQAVRHLVQHGHRRIAFAGHPVHRDLRERYEGYQEELRALGIEPDPALFFDTGDNQISGGEVAAAAMIAAALPSTAVVTGNDLNAIGLIRTLQAAGYELPREQAVIGFDDMASAVYQTPSLSSVRQDYAEVGGVAVGLLRDYLAGRKPHFLRHYVPMSLVARESCGCPDTLSLGPSGRAPDDAAAGVPATGGAGPVALREDIPAITSAQELAQCLAAIIAGTPNVAARAASVAGDELTAGNGDAIVGSASDVSAVARGVAAITGVLRAAAGGEPAPDVFRVREALAGLYERRGHPESLVEIMRCVRAFGEHHAAALEGTDLEAAARVRHSVQEVVLALAQAQARAQFRAGSHFQATLNAQYTVSMDLLRSHERDPRTLAWIEGTHARAGCLGLWSAPPQAGRLEESTLDVVAVFDRDSEQPVVPDHPVSVQAFPPAEFVERADLEFDDMVFVTPMKVNKSDWGMLSIVAPIEANVPTGREMVNQWTALLTIALDHEEVLQSLRRQEERLRHAALYDQLTGLANRTLFLDRLSEAMQRAARRPDYRFAVLLLDLDGFKVVNDSLGHLAGDRLLEHVAERIRHNVRDTDVAARFGGDEFAVLLDDIGGLDRPNAVAKRIHASLDEPFRLGDDEVVVSSSIGIALSDAGYENAEDMVRDADTAMYSSKARGKGAHVVFNAAMHAKAVDRLRTEAELRRALEQGEFEVHYQPIVQLRTGEIAGFEALLRWRHPVRGSVPPGEFLDIAEESGLIVPIGRWILRESCRQLHAWMGSGLVPDGTQISVNVSNRQFWHGRLIEDVVDCLVATNLEPRSLVVEITEGVIMHDVKLARQMLAELRELGVELHIDDFGTGYSSLGALHQLSIDALKIDRSFVTPLGTDPRSGELARTIVLMGANLGLAVIAEGIETAEQRDYLRDAGCPYGQGYWFSKPVPADEVPALVRDIMPALPAAAE
jgi:diguanylate cyclase (GGDEF)-like protein